MKTIYSIGRDPGCDIYLYDDKNVISRNHAILKIGKGGKYFISDQSMNGTYINGIKVTPGVQVPVTRKDVITFAHVSELDWNLIPDPKMKALKIILLVALIVLIAGGGTYGVMRYMDKKDVVEPPIPNVIQDNAEVQKKKEEAKQQELIEWEKRLKAEEKRKKDKEKKEQQEKEAKKAQAAEQTTEQTPNVDPII